MTQLSSAITQTLVLGELPSLAPSPLVNRTLSQLVACVTAPSTDQKLPENNTALRIQAICSKAESELEAFWAKHIAESDAPMQTMHDFIYWDNYEKLTAQEISLLQQTQFAPSNAQRILIIGSGPLPMTAVHLSHHMPTAIIDHIDSDKEAVKLGESFLHSVNIDKGNYYCAGGETAPLHNMYDLVLVIALAGNTIEAKQAIIDNILPHLTANGRLLLRSAKGIRSLLYPAFAASKLCSLELLSEHHPTDDTINSVFIYRKEQI